MRDKLAAYQTEWVATLSEELSIAIAQGEIEELDPELAAFQIDAVLRSGNTALRLGDATVIAKIRRVIEAVLHSPGS